MASYDSYFNDIKRSLGGNGTRAATMSNGFYNTTEPTREITNGPLPDSGTGSSAVNGYGGYMTTGTGTTNTAAPAETTPAATPAAAPAQTGSAAPYYGKGQKYVDQLNAIYDAALAQQKAQIEADAAGLEQYYQQAQQDAHDLYQQQLNRTAVENEKANMNWNEVKNALGLSSGTMGQAWLARQNSNQAAMTDLRAAEQKARADLELEYMKKKDQYAAALREAIAQNDYEKAKKLYELALNGVISTGGGSGSGSGGSGGGSSYPHQAAYIGKDQQEAAAEAEAAAKAAASGRRPGWVPTDDDLDLDDDKDKVNKGYSDYLGDLLEREAVYQDLSDKIAGGHAKDNNYDIYLAQIEKMHDAGRLSDAQYEKLKAQAGFKG